VEIEQSNMGELLLGCSGWNYPDNSDKEGWTGVFYPDKATKRLRYYSQFFNTAEMDSTFYEKFYSPYEECRSCPVRADFFISSSTMYVSLPAVGNACSSF
jgi:hypothetical protein